jgi:anti-sigma regulatory factor (Ser/Thr protein kinase)
MHVLFPATVESVGAARHAVRRFAADLEVDLDGIALAVSEAVANVVAHAYADGTCETVELSIETSPFELTVVVRDRGRGLADGGGCGGAGFGLPLIHRLAQHVELTDTPDGVELTMGFRRAAAPPAL